MAEPEFGAALAALAGLRTAGVQVQLRDDGTVGLDAASPPPGVVLDLARAYRDGIAALLRTERESAREAGGRALATQTHARGEAPFCPLPGVPAAWREGVASLLAFDPPGGITLARWAALAATSTYLLQSHGAKLHRTGWDALDLFGLHRRAPATNPAGWGLAWLLGAAGELLYVAPGAVGMRRGPDGARLTFRRSGQAARAGVAPAWEVAANARRSSGLAA